MLTTAYDLPFSVSHPLDPFLSTGRMVTLSVRLRENRDNDAEDRVAHALEVFCRLANTGALAGEHIDPAVSGIAAVSRSMPSPGVMVFDFERCLIDDASLIVLTMQLLHEEVSRYVESVLVQGLTPATTTLASNTEGLSSYPEQFASLPFELDDEEPESGAYTFVLELAEPLTDAGRRALAESLSAWTTCVLAGGFALPPIPPEQSYVEPDDPFIDFDRTVEWSVFKLRADPAAVSALVNLVAAFHGRCQHVVALTIQ